MSAEGKTAVVQATQIEPGFEGLKINDPLIQTVTNGEIPSNQLINEAIDRAKENLEVRKNEADLNSRGELLAKDATDILESAQKFINEKNKDDKIQELLRHTKEATTEASKEVSRTSYSMTQMFYKSFGIHFPTREAKHDAEDAYGYVRELVMFAMSSSEFRSILLDFINFFQSSLNKATDKVNQISNSIKTDVNNSDSDLNKTNATIQKTQDEIKREAENKLDQWNAQTKREYYQRFQSLLNRVSQKSEYKRLLGYYFKWMDEFKTRANEWTENLKENTKVASGEIAKSTDRVANSIAFDRMWKDIKDIVDVFAGKGTFDSFYTQAWELYDEVNRDPVARAYFFSLRRFVNDAVENPSSLNTDSKIKEGEDLIERGKEIANSSKYHAKIDKFFQTTTDSINKITQDKLTNDFASKMKKFGEHFALDAQGRPDLNVIQDSLVQIKNLVYPLLTQQLSTLTIAKIAGTNTTFDWQVENLMISVPDLIPEYFELRTKNFLKVNVKEMETEKNNTQVVMEIKNVKPVFRDLKFMYKKKSFPRIDDYGTVDVDLSKGEGARIKILWKIKSENNRPFAFSLIQVKCVIDSMDVTVKDAKHEYLDRIATSIFSANLKQALAGGIVNNIVEALQPLNDQMNEWFTTRPISSIYDKANMGLHYAYDQTNMMIKEKPLEKAYNYIADTAATAKDMAVQKTTELRDIVANKTEDLSKNLNETVEDIKSKATEIKETVVEKVNELSVKADEVKTELKTEMKTEETPFKDDDVTIIKKDKYDHAWQLKPSKIKKNRGAKVTTAFDLNKDFPSLETFSDPNPFEIKSK